MKFLDLDWPVFFTTLEEWELLSTDARFVFLSVKPSGDHRLSGEVTQELIEGAWLEQRSRSYRVVERRREFNKAMRAMDRSRVLDEAVYGGYDSDDRESLMAQYLGEHFRLEERTVLAGSQVPSVINRLHGLVGSPAWIEGFLDYRRDSPPEPESPEQQRRRGLQAGDEAWRAARRNRFEALSEPTLEAARWLLLELLDQVQPWSLEDALSSFGVGPCGTGSSADVSPFGDALDFLLREVLMLACLDDEARPFLGLWPHAAKELTRRRALGAAPVTSEVPAEIVERPVLIEDILALLVECAIEPPRLKADSFVLFARNTKALAARLSPLPKWLGSEQAGWSPEQRCRNACHQAHALGLVRTAGLPGRDLRLLVTAAGESWTALSSEQRLRSVLDGLTDDKVPTIDQRDGTSGAPGQSGLPFVPLSARSGYWFWNVDLRPALVALFRQVPVDRYVRLAPFLHQQAPAANPFASARKTRHWISREDIEQSWTHACVGFFFRRLVALGAIAIGVLERDYLLRLTPVGQYLLGLADDFELESVEEKADLIVQPNLDIVLLAPAPSAGQRLSAFASPTSEQRAGETVGNLYQLTKESVQRAAAVGYDSERLLAELRELSSQPIPNNVETQVTAWLDSVRWARVRPALLLEADDAETAARILVAAGKGGNLLSETVVELPAASALTPKVRRSLMQSGVFVREPNV